MQPKAKNRRWLLTSAAAVAAAGGATVVTHRTAEAGAGIMWYGLVNDAGTSLTTLKSTRDTFTLHVLNDAGKTAVYGQGGVGIQGYGYSGVGVVGHSSTGTGVKGVSQTGTGVYGESVNDNGVYGQATGDGVGVLARASASAGGTALKVEGTALFKGTAAFIGGMSGNANGLVALNATKLAGTVPDTNLSSNIPRKDATSNVFTGSINASSFNGAGSGLTSLDASELAPGTVPDARLSANIPVKDAVINEFAGRIGAQIFAGDGSLLTNLPSPAEIDATAITTGTLADARLSSNVALTNKTGGTVFKGRVSARSFSSPSGVPKFPTVGVATIPAGGSQVHVQHAAASATTVIMAVLQSDPGAAVAIRHIARGVGFFDVFLTGAAPAGATVGYMIVAKP